MASKVPTVLVTQHGGCCTWTRWPPLPTLSTRPLRGSRRCPDFVGWAGLRWGSPCAGSRGTAWGSWQEGPAPGLAQRGQVRSLQRPLPLLKRVPATCGDSACFTHLGPGGTGATGCGGAQGSLPASRLPIPSTPTPWRQKRSSVCRRASAGQERERRAGPRGSWRREVLPSPITGTDLIYLFWLKKEQKQLCIAFGLTHKRSYPQACLRVLLSGHPTPFLSPQRSWPRPPHPV